MDGYQERKDHNQVAGDRSLHSNYSSASRHWLLHEARRSIAPLRTCCCGAMGAETSKPWAIALHPPQHGMQFHCCQISGWKWIRLGTLARFWSGCHEYFQGCMADAV